MAHVARREYAGYLRTVTLIKVKLMLLKLSIDMSVIISLRFDFACPTGGLLNLFDVPLSERV